MTSVDGISSHVNRCRPPPSPRESGQSVTRPQGRRIRERALCYLRAVHGVPVETQFLWMVGRGFSSQARVPGP
jgi:hypothetical protein